MKSLLAPLVVLIPQVVAAAEVVATKINPANGHAYALVRADDPKAGISWADANEFAKSIGGHLVAINDEAERRWLIDAFPVEKDSPLDNYYWIGLTDAEKEGEFKWTNGEPFEFAAWQKGLEPNDAGQGEDYAHVYNFARGGYQWNDLPNRPLFRPTEGSYPMSAVVELPEGLGDDPFAGVYHGIDGKGNPIIAIPLGGDKYELKTRNWSGIGFWDRVNKCYEGTYRYPGPAKGPDPDGVVGYHRISPVGDDLFAVIAVGDVGHSPLPAPFMIKRVEAAKRSPEAGVVPR